MQAGDRRRALVLDYAPPAPASSSGSPRTLGFVELLAGDGWHVAVATAEPLTDPRDARKLRQAGIPVYDGTTAELETVLGVGAFRVAIAMSWQIAELYLSTIRRLCPTTAVVVDCPGLQLARDARRTFGPMSRGEPGPWLGAEYGSEAAGELNAYASADVVLTASAADAELIELLLGDRQLASWVPDADEDREAAGGRLLEALALGQDRQASSRPPVKGSRERFELRLRRRRNRKLLPELREVVRTSVSADARVLVISEGSDELLRLGRDGIAHFPQRAADGEPATRPSDSGEAIALLEHEIRAGADILLIPSTTSEWVDSYPAFRDYLLDRFTLREEGSCTVVELRGERVDSPSAPASPVRLIAFYLPQFHAIPENDRWWGPGFTEWSNVVRARPLFPGHDQPKVPGELGFYDLRSTETREAQARLAAEAGIEAFCYYHYWFHGKRLLETPFVEVLESGRPDFPFCLCWANEPWSRRWDGSEDDVLQPQSYSAEDDLAHIRWLIPALADPRAVTVASRPLFLVYRARSLPDPARTADLWREEARKAGLPGLHLVSVETRRDRGWNPTLAGFDASVRFQPEFSTLEDVPMHAVDGPSTLRVWSYEQAWKHISRGDPPAYRRYESVFPAWDNTPRRGERGWVLHGSTPESYGRWLTQAAGDALSQPPEQRLVFLNAWNEWAEGAYLEPDRRHGRAYLQATRAVVDAISQRRPGEERDARRAAASSLDEPVGVG